MKDLKDMTIAEISSLLRNRQVSSSEVTEYFIRRIHNNDGRIGAYITADADRAMADAKKADEILNKNGGDMLTGIPVALKDNICVSGMLTTCGSKMLENFVPPYDATVWKSLRDRGAVLLGKTNMDEFGMGSSCENSAFKKTINPIDPLRSPGGSSGGSAAAVASGETVYALGSDTGGSVRQPAAFCGLVGLKPTYGRVSRLGLVAFASSMDQIGPITRTVRDNAAVFGAMAGHDKGDSTSACDVCRRVTLKETGKKLRVGIVREFMGKTSHGETDGAVYGAAKALQEQGAEIREISLPNFKYALTAYYVISSAEASSNLARYDGIRYGHRSKNAGDIRELMVNSRTEAFGDEVKRRIMTGTFVLSSGYQKKILRFRRKGQRAYKIRLQKSFS